MFAFHQALVNDSLERDGDVEPQTELTDMDVALLEYFRDNVTFPAVPGSDLCMQHAAVVVTEAGIEEQKESVPFSSLEQVGKLQLMVTDVDHAFPKYAELTGGREIGSFRVVGFEKDGVVELNAVDKYWAPLPVIFDGEKRVVVIKGATGEWLLPPPESGTRLVVCAVPLFAPHLDAIDGMAAGVKAAGDATEKTTRPMMDATNGAANAAFVAVGDMTKPLTDASGKALDATGQVRVLFLIPSQPI